MPKRTIIQKTLDDKLSYFIICKYDNEGEIVPVYYFLNYLALLVISLLNFTYVSHNYYNL